MLQPFARAKRTSPPPSIACSAPARALVTTWVGALVRLVDADEEVGRVRRVGCLCDLGACLPDPLGDQRGDRNRPNPVERAVEEQQEDDEADDEQDLGRRHADVGHERIGHPPQLLHRERQGAEQDGEDELEHPVSEPQAHVAGGERTLGDLHDEDADGDDEPCQRCARTDDRGEDRRRRRRGVLPAPAERDVLVEQDPGRGEHRTEERAGQRHHPDAACQILAQPKANGPGHRGSISREAWQMTRMG